MKLNRRKFIQAIGALSGALAVKMSGLEVLASTQPPVIWIQGQSCTGCSVSLLNSITEMSIDELLLNVIDLEFHPTVMASAGSVASSHVEGVAAAGGYVLIVEGAVPVGEAGDFCHVWENTTMMDAVTRLVPAANAVISVGTCASFGGIPAANPNPTNALGMKDAMNYLGVSNSTVINLPGCPAHPDWVVGTVAALLSGAVPALDRHSRPRMFYGDLVHSNCPNRGSKFRARALGDPGCMANIGCKGQRTGADCPIRQWNAAENGGTGVNWCIGARTPCQGCTEPDFPDGKSPFYSL